MNKLNLSRLITYSFGFELKLISLTGLFCLTCSSMGCNSTEDNTVNNSATGSTYSQSSGTVTETGKTYSSVTADLSAVKVTGGTYNISNSVISSTGSTSSTDNSSFYGLNAVILAYASSGTAVINSSGNKVTSSGTGANGIFAYGTAKVTTSGDHLTHTGGGGHAIYCAGGGTITVTKDTAETSGGSSSTIATDRGGGTITITGGTYKANGSNSAAIYSTGVVNCTDATLTTTGAEALVIEGANHITLNNCTVKCTYNKWGSMIYQSMSGDAAGTDGYLTMTGGKFTYTGNAGGLFYNTNSTAIIVLDGVSLVNSCDTLVRCIKGSWGGSSASSGGITSLTAKNQTLSGLIHVDVNSKASVKLLSSSVFTGAINKSNTAKSANISLDASSSWSLTATSYVDTISNSLGISGTSCTNITGNGYNIYYKPALNSYLGSKIYTLVNGGYLLPVGSTTGVKSIGSDGTAITIQNYPNPVKLSTTISYHVTASSLVSLKIYDNSGQLIDTLVSAKKVPGNYQESWTPQVPDGNYICQLTSDGNSKSIKIIVLK